MKFWVGISILIFLGLQASATNVVASCSKSPRTQGGDAHPWPWGSETTFPWSRIQGVWAPADPENCGTYFVFKVGNRAEDGSRFIRITEYDPTTCRRVSSGLGVETEKVIYAQMAAGRSIFSLAVRAFDPAVLNNPLCLDSASDESVIVMSMYPRSDWDRRTSFELKKLQSATSMLCAE